MLYASERLLLLAPEKQQFACMWLIEVDGNASQQVCPTELDLRIQVIQGHQINTLAGSRPLGRNRYSFDRSPAFTYFPVPRRNMPAYPCEPSLRRIFQHTPVCRFIQPNIRRMMGRLLDVWRVSDMHKLFRELDVSLRLLDIFGRIHNNSEIQSRQNRSVRKVSHAGEYPNRHSQMSRECLIVVIAQRLRRQKRRHPIYRPYASRK